jgi:NAD(P)H-dependent FMN reductase
MSTISSSKPKIAVVIGSTRPGRLGTEVADWVARQAKDRQHADYEVLDVAEFDLDLLSEPTVPGAADRAYDNDKTRRWSRAVDEFDGFVFVTPEYNHSVPAAMKNAFDVLYPEWGNKSVAFVGYGADGATRAVEHWRTIVANARMVAVRAQVSLSLFQDFQDGELVPLERREGELTTVFEQVEQMAGALAPLRAA